jgi:hypothetical protein
LARIGIIDSNDESVGLLETRLRRESGSNEK